MADIELQYHGRALQLIGRVPKLAKDANVIASIENRIGRRLPNSLREWYSLEGACDLLTRFSNQDRAIPVTKLGMDSSIAQDLLVIRHENQGVCIWAVQLDSSDNPPVLVNYGDSDETYQPCARTFSDYVYSCIWDYGLVLTRDDGLIQAQNAPISEDALYILRQHFQVELETRGWPGEVQYRFFSRDQRILIWAGKDQADWWLTGDTEDALQRLVRQVWDLDELGQSLWANDEVGESVLERIREGK